MFFEQLDPSWQLLLADQRAELSRIEQSIAAQQITPEIGQVMRAFSLPVSKLKVLLVGQDPYPTRGTAVGLAFAVANPEKPPRSLQNLMLELSSDYPGIAASGRIENWQQRGVMLLNSSLTTRIGEPAAHSKIWRNFIERAITRLDEQANGQLVVLALGKQAQQIALLASAARVVSAAHPSPLSASRGFFGSRVFSKVNSELSDLSIAQLDWSC